MTDIEQDMSHNFSYGLAARLGKRYQYLENIRADMEFAESMHASVVLIGNQLRDEFRDTERLV